ncbi:MAG: hypothetical protein Tsb0013_16120 [Phycisphaerales bacterium]
MIKSLWTILVTLAIANLLGFVIFVTWLMGSGRLSEDRIVSLRELFSTTVAVQEAKDEQAQREASAQEDQRRELDAVGTPPISATGREVYEEELARSVEGQAARTLREARDRQETLFKWQRDLEQREEALRAEKLAFERLRAEITAREGDEQFKKALKVYEGLPPDEVAGLFAEMVRSGGEDDVVAFLDAMKPRIASDIMSAVQGDDVALAARLLERLREYGLTADATPEEPG